MKEYKLKKYGYERALYGEKDILVENCEFSGIEDGESALKETQNVSAKNCKFALRYPLWHTKNTEIIDCEMLLSCRAPLWYDDNIKLNKCKILGVKAIRECNLVKIDNCDIDSEEFCWKTKDILVKNSKISGFYSFFMCDNLLIENIKFDGKYSFQYVKNGVVKNSILNTKDAFWHTENVTVYDSEVNGEYLGWYSKNLKLVNCKISGTQPLCYAENLVLENCTMINCDLAFENSTVNATIKGSVLSVKNPKGGSICADSIDEIIIDKFVRGNCKIETK